MMMIMIMIICWQGAAPEVVADKQGRIEGGPSPTCGGDCFRCIQT